MAKSSIAVLRIDLGKNSCSLVGFDVTEGVVLRYQATTGTGLAPQKWLFVISCGFPVRSPFVMRRTELGDGAAARGSWLPGTLHRRRA